MKNNKLGSGNKETGSVDFFNCPEIKDRYENLQREKRNMPIDEFQEFRDKCKMGLAERWNVVARDTVISETSAEIISRYLGNNYPNAQRTVSCILDYFSGRRKIDIQLDPNNIPVKHRVKSKRINLAYRDCEQLREKYVKKVSEKLANGSWESLPAEDRDYYQEQYRALLIAMKFSNYYLKKLLSGEVSKDNLSAAQFEEAAIHDNRMHDWYHRNVDGSYSLNTREKSLSYQMMSQECASVLICKEYENN